MNPITRPYKRKDGSKRRVYMCRHVVTGTGLCDAPSINAEITDNSIIANLQHYLGDFEACRKGIEDEQAGQRETLRREVQHAQDDLAAVTDLTAKIERDYERHLSAGHEAEAAAVLSILTRRRDDRDRAEIRLRAARDALAAVPADAMLDPYNGLAAAVRGRLDEPTRCRRSTRRSATCSPPSCSAPSTTICLPCRLAFYEAEDPGVRLILERR